MTKGPTFPTGMFISPFVKKMAKISPFIGRKREKKKDVGTCEGLRVNEYSFPAALDTGVPTTERDPTTPPVSRL